MEFGGAIDPENIDEYIAVGGYEALKKVVTGMKPAEVIEEIKKSGLRGKGGGGFVTGQQMGKSRQRPHARRRALHSGQRRRRQSRFLHG